MAGFLPSLENFAKGTFATAAGLTTVGAGLLYYGQNYLIYPSAFPPGSRTDVPTPGQYGIPYHDLELKTEDGVRLRCFLLAQIKELRQPGALQIPCPPGLTDDEFASTRPTVIMFHGNGGNVGHRVPLANVFFLKMRCNVLMVSYRGYGLSEGNPSEKGIKIDAQSALDYVKSHPALNKTSIILYGQSIGGAVSIDLASRNPLAIRALILENTFLSLPRLVPSALPPLGPFAFLCHQKWDSASKVPLIPRKTPILMLSGSRDEVVPPEHMRELWELVKKREGGIPGGAGTKEKLSTLAVEEETKKVSVAAVDVRSLSKFVEFPEGTHNDTCVQPEYWLRVAEFIESIARSSP